MRRIKKYDFTSKVMLAWTCLCLLLHQLLHLIPPLLTPSVPPLFCPASRPLSSIYTAGCCLFVSIVVLFVCIVSGVDNRPLGSIKDRMAAFQGNGKLCVCVCLCMLPVSACNRMNICMTVCCPPPPGSGVGVSSAAGAKSSEVRRNPPT